MNPAGTPGPEVAASENLYRCITTPDWWVAGENRPSSAALKQPDFSTDRVSIAKSPDYTLRRFPAGSGLIEFNYGDAKDLGFVAREELDPQFPENLAHANVYNGAGSGKRKTMAARLIEILIAKNGIVVIPSFSNR